MPITDNREISRRRSLHLFAFSLAGLVTSCSRKSSSKEDATRGVTIVEFSDAGKKEGPVRKNRVIRSDSDWRERLTAEQFFVTRRHTTDTPFTGTYYRNHDVGLYRCICCANAVFSSETKFDSSSGWPSFWAPIASENIQTRLDTSIAEQRTDVSCTLCDAHLGHLFDDGPPPTNLRYCMNESSLRFVRG